MKFTLKDYQAEAADDLLQSLGKARTIVDIEGKPVSVSLSATTGAGKTVIAASVIEALFYGTDAFATDYEPDPGAVVIWFSDDPNLNEQTRFRLMEASDKLNYTDLVVIEPPFAKARLEPGKVYFLNTQKLSKSSLLTRGHADFSDASVLETMTTSASPDLQGWTIWQTIANTIDSSDLNVYLVIDEAHRGFGGKTSKEKSTIVSRLVNGHAGYPPIPIVWGISATIDNFKEAMEKAEVHGRRALPPVSVDGFRVQESGLIKDAVILDIPAEAGNFDGVLVRRAAKKLRESTDNWERYARNQTVKDLVKPLLILQAPNTPDPEQIGRALDYIFAEFPELDGNAVRHVFGDHTTQRFGAWEVDWIEPQRVEDETRVRVLVAKDAISTGWDCPRAEVMVSFRPAKDHTYITQLLGRMVRSPLARRIPGDDKLNAVECVLPFFDRTTAGNVVKYLTGQIGDVAPPTRKVVISECLLMPNADVPESVWLTWDVMPTVTIPQRGAAPVKRLTLLALALSSDGLRLGAVAEATAEMHLVLDAARARYPRLLESAVNEIWSVRGQTITGRQSGTQLTYKDFIEFADDRAIQVGFKDAMKAFGGDVSTSYVNELNLDDDDDGLRDAFVTTAALAIIPEVRTEIDREADALASKWFAEHRVAIKSLTDDRQQEYADIQALATHPQRGSLTRPRTRIEDYIEIGPEGQQSFAPTAVRHLMADDKGTMPIGALNEWEREVVMRELTREDCLAWYRNPPRQSVDSLGVAYRDEVGNWRSMHPDFVFFNDVNGVTRPSIVDPHGHHLEDSVIKLQGLAEFAAQYGGEFHRIEAVTKIGNKMLVLDMTSPEVREAVQLTDQTVTALYNTLGSDYD